MIAPILAVAFMASAMAAFCCFFRRRRYNNNEGKENASTTEHLAVQSVAGTNTFSNSGVPKIVLEPENELVEVTVNLPEGKLGLSIGNHNGNHVIQKVDEDS